MAQIATLNARFAVPDGATTTRLVDYSASAPLKIARPFEQANGGITVCLMDASPGLLAGDDYRLNWHLEGGADVSVTTQGFTRVHPLSTLKQAGPNPESFHSRMQTCITVEKGATLSFLPDPTLLYKDSHFKGELSAHVAAGASLVLSDSFVAGRIARDEKFEFGLFQNAVSIRDEKGPLFCNQSRLKPDEMNPTSFAICGGWTHIATLIAVNDAIDENWLAVSRETIEAFDKSGIRACASLMPRRTIVVNLFARRAHEIQQAILGLTQNWKTSNEATVSRETATSASSLS